MNVFLRKRVRKDSKIASLYLEIYKGYAIDENGRKRNLKEYESLPYFVYTQPKTPLHKKHNKETEKIADSIRGERYKDLVNGKYGIKSTSRRRANLIHYFEKLTQDRRESKGNYGNWDSALKHLRDYCPASITFEQVDTEFIEGFKTHLLKKAKTKSGKTLSNNSALSYFNKLRAAINKAFVDGIIDDNPVKRVTGIKQLDSHREYLTLDELKAIAKAECRYEILKRAFIFSCLTGLRWSDIYKMTWSELEEFNDGWRIRFTQKKTKGVEYLDISEQAREYMGERGSPDERVFVGLKYSSYMNVALTQWMLKAGITKPITFHCGRHTFATIQLTLGTEIYTVSKLLGHTELKTTMIYGKIIDQKKKDAVNQIPKLID